MTSMMTGTFYGWLEEATDEELMKRLNDLKLAGEAIERKLVERTTVRDVTWMLKHIEQSTFVRAIDRAIKSMGSMDRQRFERAEAMIRQMDQMDPLDIKNKFGLSLDRAKVDAALAYLGLDNEVCSAWRDVRTGNIDWYGEDTQNIFDMLAIDALGFTLPHDWTGEVDIARDEQAKAADPATVGPQAFKVYARTRNASAYLASRRTLAEAYELADRLVLIDANSWFEQHHEKAARLARLRADFDRRDADRPWVGQCFGDLSRQGQGVASLGG